MSIAALLDRLAYSLAGPYRKSFYSTLENCLSKKDVINNEVFLVRVYVMKMYCLSVDGYIQMALYLYESIKNQIHIITKYELEMIMARESLLITNRISELIEKSDLFKFDAFYIFNLLLMENNLKECKKYCLSLIKTHPNASMALLLQENTFTENTTLVILKMLLKRIQVSNSLICLLLNRNIPYDILKEYAVTNIIGKPLDIPSMLLLKKLVLIGVSIEEYGYTIDTLLDNLDDWDIYEYCLNKKIQVSEKSKKSINYLTYKISLKIEPESVVEYVKRSSNLDFILNRISKECENTKEHCLSSLKSVDPIRYTYLNNPEFDFYREYSAEKISIFKKYSNNLTDFIFLIGVLIKTKNPTGIIDALLLLLLKRKELPNNRYVQLLICSIYRYLSLYDCVVEEYKGLNAHTVQLECLSYLWSDLKVIYSNWLGIELSDELDKKYLNQRLLSIGSVNTNIIQLTENQEYNQLVSLLEYRNKIINSPAYMQIKENKFYPLSAPPSIESIIIKESRYVLEKIITYPKTDPNSVFITAQDIPQKFQKSEIVRIIKESVSIINSYTEIPEDIISKVMSIPDKQEYLWDAHIKKHQTHKQ
ncbi:uncharacterized protein NEPG_01810 [Nematocida parisii ERTm1]|uniref:uncharacterized protein n=1 Tax=Nematocida parisii (strain ERTm1 / ATCC PRA-289) TaxID=881290 RepID=UPI000264B57F|nr:uncharacterized protein NEPG_01810 [Nematocida parisii ERTm1]EIJ93468.1 hypothetical protein NEPG_01810 [Nematocida parisii ERTm1]|eukprot:XP_013059638.1 hypothetical protein NEPG_01810 [Nematocida parisii ERTm1]